MEKQPDCASLSLHELHLYFSFELATYNWQVYMYKMKVLCFPVDKNQKLAQFANHPIRSEVAAPKWLISE